MKLWLICIPPACENRRVLGPVIEMIWADFENILTFVSIDMMWINYPFLRSQISPHYLHVHLHRVSTRLNRIIALVINVSACHHWDVQDLVKNVYSNPLCVNLALYRVQNIPKTCIDADIARSAEFRGKNFAIQRITLFSGENGPLSLEAQRISYSFQISRYHPAPPKLHLEGTNSMEFFLE